MLLQIKLKFEHRFGYINQLTFQEKYVSVPEDMDSESKVTEIRDPGFHHRSIVPDSSSRTCNLGARGNTWTQYLKIPGQYYSRTRSPKSFVYLYTRHVNKGGSLFLALVSCRVFYVSTSLCGAGRLVDVLFRQSHVCLSPLCLCQLDFLPGSN